MNRTRDAEQLPDSIRQTTRKPQVYRSKETWAVTESMNTNSKYPGLDTREFDIANHEARQALMRFVCWAIVNGHGVTVSPKLAND